MVAEKELAIMLLDALCACLYGETHRNAHKEPLRQGPKAGGRHLMGKLKTAMKVTRHAPQICGGRYCQGADGSEGVQSERVAPVGLLAERRRCLVLWRHGVLYVTFKLKNGPCVGSSLSGGQYGKSLGYIVTQPA